ncbi:hypothetical protein SO802_033847 [Lithocarpus litseifolius]|uniref:Uncharacterized protein n=1 Tax=Lithocarpus litseifolius TaxID=425828 RepID=A0AAW2BGY2_9ROSI
MFNLDALNEVRLEVMPNSTWDRGQIPESQFRIVKKRIHKEIGRLGRNIRQNLLCGFYSRELTNGNYEEDLDHVVSEIERNSAEDDILERLEAIDTDNQNGNRNEGGLGLKKFGLMSQSMLAKQFWRINQYLQSLLAKALKPKYFPRCTIQECSLKPHHSWYWRNIIKQDNIKLREARWLIGRGTNISLHHPDWFRCSEQNLLNAHLEFGIVANLIDQSRGVWKCDLIKKLYLHHQCDEILRIPISKIGVISDTFLWKHSSSGACSVRKAYNLLLRDHFQDSHS